MKAWAILYSQEDCRSHFKVQTGFCVYGILGKKLGLYGKIYYKKSAALMV